MNLISDDVINEKLYDVYTYYVALYGQEKIYGSFVIGNANYGFAKTEQEIKVVTIYIPSFEDLCLGSFPTDINLYDIRDIYNADSPDSKVVSALELLFTKYYIITSKYEDNFNNYFINNRNLIAQYSKKNRLTKAYRKALEAKEMKNMFEAMRLCTAAAIYCTNPDDYDACYHMEDHGFHLYQSLLQQVKDGGNINIDKAIGTFNIQLSKVKDDYNFEAHRAIKDGIIEAVGISFKVEVPIDAFVSGLSQTEKQAWDVLRPHLATGGMLVSISQLTEENGISRPVWKNLFTKMEKAKIATIESHGAKGTQITML